MENSDIKQKIIRLKTERNAVILAHLYQLPEVQDIADFVGDSLELAKTAAKTSADVIVFCGVFFMAETAKILNPEKTVLMPDLNAGCPMADMVTADDVSALKSAHPKAAVVCYINSNAEVKAVSDICCTSSNALRVVTSLANKEIIFVPDRNLGRYIADKLPEKQFIFHEGFCPVHNCVSGYYIDKARREHPDALVLVHPECTPEVTEKSDFCGSTAQIIEFVGASREKDFIIGTESGIFHRLETLYPDKSFYSLGSGLTCPDMKRISLSGVLTSLENNRHQITVDKDTADRAYQAINKMLAVK